MYYRVYRDKESKTLNGDNAKNILYSRGVTWSREHEAIRYSICEAIDTTTNSDGKWYKLIGVTGGSAWFLKQTITQVDLDSVPMKDRLFSKKLMEVFLSIDSKLSNELFANWSFVSSVKDISNVNLKANGSLSYRKAGKQSIVTDEGKWDASTRESANPGRALMKIIAMLGITATKFEVEELVNAIKSTAGSMDNFEIVKGDDLINFYNEKTYDYSVDTGSMSRSCMRNAECKPFLEIYKDNPDICSMLIYYSGAKKNKRISARALLWKTDEGVTFMDRVYGSDAIAELFKEYAKKEGYLYKPRQTFQDKDLVVVEGSTVSKLMSITLTKPLSEYSNYPYFDTFTWDDGDSKLINNPSKAVIGRFDNIHGSYIKIRTCEISGIRGFDEVSVYIRHDGNRGEALNQYLIWSDYYDSMLDISKAVKCPSGSVVYPDNKAVVYIEHLNVHELSKYTFRDSVVDKVYPVYMTDGNSTINAKIKLKNGKYVHLMNKNLVKEDTTEVAEPKKKASTTFIDDYLSTRPSTGWMDESRAHAFAWGNVPVTLATDDEPDELVF